MNQHLTDKVSTKTECIILRKGRIHCEAIVLHLFTGVPSNLVAQYRIGNIQFILRAISALSYEPQNPSCTAAFQGGLHQV